mgnify:CR=1 FL=1
MSKTNNIFPEDEFDNEISEPTDKELVEIESTLISDFLIDEDEDIDFTIIGQA